VCGGSWGLGDGSDSSGGDGSGSLVSSSAGFGSGDLGGSVICMVG
jgi:hypothetical protein